MSISLIYDPAYLTHDTGQHHPENAHRLEAVLETLNASELSSRLKIVKPAPAGLDDLVRCHHLELATEVKALCDSGSTFVDADTRISRPSYDVALLAAGAAI